VEQFPDHHSVGADQSPIRQRPAASQHIRQIYHGQSEPHAICSGNNVCVPAFFLAGHREVSKFMLLNMWVDDESVDNACLHLQIDSTGK